MVNPLATMLIFTLVFRVILKIDPPRGDPSGLKNFPFFLLSALLPWNLLANGLSAATTAVVGNAGLVKKVYFPRGVLPAAGVFSWVTNLLIELGVLTIALLVIGKVALAFLPIALVVVFLQAMFVLGIGLAFSALNVYFRDVQHFLSILLLLWFYATPIIYPYSLIPERRVIGGFDIPLRLIYNLNPMVHFTRAYRALFYDLKVPDLMNFAEMLVSAVVAMVIGFWIFKKLEPRFAEEL